MQFHQDGFRSGDPSIAEPMAGLVTSGSSEELPKEVDVLIVGCGPAGLTLAAQLSVFPSIRTLIIELKEDRLKLGQADGIACRSMEMFQTFGFAGQIMREGYWVNETAFWKPDATSPDNITRSSSVQDVEDGLSEFPHMILNQARVQDFFLDFMLRSSTRLEPHYSCELKDLTVDPEASDYPVIVKVAQRAELDKPENHTIRARYVVGCDGARSVTRKCINRPLQGDSANKAWGVMDVLAITDFPDIRKKVLIQSSGKGSIVIIPREGGYLVRIYVELDSLGKEERVANRNITSENLVEATNRILHPYTIDVREIAWWSVYEIGQRVCDKFDDVPDSEITQRHPRVFIAGDACHTHSPKAGQGMNVSMRDSFNLGWKLAAVLTGRAQAKLLHTYSAERSAVAKELINFDREWAEIVSTRSAQEQNKHILAQYFKKSGRYTAGTAIKYSSSLICKPSTHQQLAEGFEIGSRFHSSMVIRLADAKPMQLGHVVTADGRWRVFVFAGEGDRGAATDPLGLLCTFLLQSGESPLQRFNSAADDIDAVIDVRAIIQQHHREVDITSMPSLLRPKKGRYGLCDYEKVFCTLPHNGQDIYALRAIDRRQGCMVVVRPDQHIATILPLNHHNELAGFFAGFMQAKLDQD